MSQLEWGWVEENSDALRALFALLHNYTFKCGVSSGVCVFAGVFCLVCVHVCRGVFWLLAFAFVCLLASVCVCVSVLKKLQNDTQKKTKQRLVF